MPRRSIWPRASSLLVWKNLPHCRSTRSQGKEARSQEARSQNGECLFWLLGFWLLASWLLGFWLLASGFWLLASGFLLFLEHPLQRHLHDSRISRSQDSAEGRVT